MKPIGTSYDYIRGLKWIHKALLISNVAFCAVCALIISNTNFTPKAGSGVDKTLMFVAPLLSIFGIIYGNWIFKKKIDAILQTPTQKLSEKLIPYRTASLLRWAITEMPLIVCNILLFITGDYYYIIFIFISLIFFILYTPSKEQVIAHLHLSSQEQLILEEEYAEIH